jgi:hypothetical protein
MNSKEYNRNIGIVLIVLIIGIILIPVGSAANQLILLDKTYDHTTTTKAFSFFNLPSGIPGNFISPVDYAHGTLYQRLVVITKPSDKTVKYQICLFQDQIIPEKHACSNEGLLSFTRTGTYYASQQMTSLFQYTNINWGRNLLTEMLVVKDKNGKPVDDRYGWAGTWDGSPNFGLYYPMRVRYTAIVIPPGGGLPVWPSNPTQLPTPSPTPFPTLNPTPIPLPSGNLAQNAGLEVDNNKDGKPDNWYMNVWGGSAGKIAFSWATDYKHGGTHSVKIISTDTTGKARWMTGRNIGVVPGKKYSLNAYIKTSSVNSAYITITFWDGNLGYITGASSNKISGTRDWTQVAGSAVAPANARYARVELRIQGTGTIWYDDVIFINPTTIPSATPLPTPTPAQQPSDNLAPNPGMEVDNNKDGKPDSWNTNVWGGSASKIAFSWATDYKQGGTHSVKITSTDTTGKARWMTGRNIGVVPGKKYSFSTYTKTSGAGKAYMYVTFWNSAMSYISGASTGSKSGTNNWIMIQGGVVAPAGATYARIEERLDGEGTAWFDGVTFMTQ